LHRHLFARNDVAFDQDAPDRRITVAVVRIVVYAHHRAIVHADARRALDLDEQQVGLALEPGNFQPASGDGAILDLGPVVIGHELAPADFAKHLAAIGQALRALRIA